MATEFQRCKTEWTPPCEKPRCDHGWTTRYREPGGRSGKQREKSFRTKREAVAFGTKMEADKDAGTYLDPSRGKILVRDLVPNWLDDRVLLEDTKHNYKTFFEMWIEPVIGRRMIGTIRRTDAQKLINAMIEGGLSAKTINDRMALVGSFFRWCINDQRMSEHPCIDLRLPRMAGQAVNDDDIPDLDQIHALEEHMPEITKLGIWLMSGLGLRSAEAWGFSEDCVREDTVRIYQQASRKANNPDFMHPLVPLKHRAAGEYRDIPFGTVIGDKIAAHIDRHGVWERSGTGLLIPHHRADGRTVLYTSSTIAHWWAKASKAAGLVDHEGKPLFHPHGLRHFFASTALTNLVPIHEVSRWLGHKSIKTTVDVYGHLVPASGSRFRIAMDNALSQPQLQLAA
ncbi:site-specific integrase [Pseudonocardiaceae bacterium YIM PH 21723]|nr:site-specific integrase [Pseudonocardiaceae bacterium YIM PH 21723]